MAGEVSFRHAEPVMGTIVSFDLRPRGLPYARTQAALKRACDVLHRADNVFSLYKPDSPLSRLRLGELTLTDCPQEISAVLALCQRAREQSGGWFDPWGLPGGVDPTGLVKGWAAQQAAHVLRQAGLAAGMVNAAGDIIVFGRPTLHRSWQVGVRAPDNPNRLLCAIPAEGAVATSGSYARGEHILNARTGTPARAALSATVCGPDLSYADAFATGLIAAGPDGLDTVRNAGYEALLVLPDGTQAPTADFPI